jgi:hypothetical protein
MHIPFQAKIPIDDITGRATGRDVGSQVIQAVEELEMVIESIAVVPLLWSDD